MLISFSSLQGQGVSFMDWSFHYLNGAKDFWHWKKGITDLNTNPLSGFNSHGHAKNHPKDLTEIKQFIDQALERGGDLVTFYPWISNRPDILPRYRDMLTQGFRKGVHQIWIRSTKRYPYFSERTGVPNDDAIKKWLNLYEADFITLREQTSLKMIKNKNDILAKMKTFDQEIGQYLDLSVRDTDWWYRTEDCMVDIFDAFKMSINDSRMRDWRPIMLSWRAKILEMVDWYEKKVPEIVQAIVYNLDLDITGYNLDILGQATIMAHTMKDHGRRLLLPDEKFPKNTKELHLLLK